MNKRWLPYIRSDHRDQPFKQPIMVLKDPVPPILSGRWAVWLNTLPPDERYGKQLATTRLWMDQEGLLTKEQNEVKET